MQSNINATFDNSQKMHGAYYVLYDFYIVAFIIKSLGKYINIQNELMRIHYEDKLQKLNEFTLN